MSSSLPAGRHFPERIRDPDHFLFPNKLSRQQPLAIERAQVHGLVLPPIRIKEALLFKRRHCAIESIVQEVIGKTRAAAPSTDNEDVMARTHGAPRKAPRSSGENRESAKWSAGKSFTREKQRLYTMTCIALSRLRIMPFRPLPLNTPKVLLLSQIAADWLEKLGEGRR